MGGYIWGNFAPEALTAPSKLVNWTLAGHDSKISLRRATALLGPLTLDSRSTYAPSWEMSVAGGVEQRAA